MATCLEFQLCGGQRFKIESYRVKGCIATNKSPNRTWLSFEPIGKPLCTDTIVIAEPVSEVQAKLDAAGCGRQEFPPCTTCKGEGIWHDRQCPDCEGSGVDETHPMARAAAQRGE